MNVAAGEPVPPPELCDALGAAADRLLASTPLHSDGALTIVGLAREAGIKRWLLTHKYPYQLKAKYQAMFAAAGNKSAPVRAAEHDVKSLHHDLQRARAANRRLEHLTQTYATIISQLVDELAHAEAEIRTIDRRSRAAESLPRIR